MNPSTKLALVDGAQNNYQMYFLNDKVIKIIGLEGTSKVF